MIANPGRAARKITTYCLIAFSLAGTAAAQTAHAGDPIARGKYLATAGDCIACHTAPGGKPLAGGLIMQTPFGTLSTPNITPDKETGIGGWSDDDFYHALHEGVAKDGDHLYPAFPYPWYTHVTRDDVLAIKAYLFSLPPVHAPRQPSQMNFPFNIRASLAAWNSVFLHDTEFTPDPAKSAEINRGAYLVNGLGHCGECHNGNSMLGNSRWSDRLQGGQIENWYAPNLTSDVREGIGGWSVEQLATYLKSGTAPGKGVVLGPMAETIRDSLRHLTDADLRAIAVYLKSTPPEASYKPASPAVPAGGQPSGAAAYLDNCAFCHQLNGKGTPGVIPALAGNGAVLAEGPENVIRVVLGGVQATGTYAPMPAVGAGMTDQEVADAVNYVRQAWGNAAPANAQSGKVAEIRADTNAAPTASGAGNCPAIADPALAKTVGDPQSGLRDLLRGVTLANMDRQIDLMIPKIKSADPTVSNAGLVNGLSAAYCPVVHADATISDPQRTWQQNQFAARLYTKVNASGAHRG